MITYKNVDGHYEIYVNDELNCTCETNELNQEIENIKNELSNEMFTNN